MTVRMDGETIALPEAGLVVHPVTVMLRDAATHPPANGVAVWILVQFELDRYWELGEYQDGGGTFDEGWYLIGSDRPLHNDGYRVLFWANLPPVPDLEKLGWFDEA
ncbi:MAG: hypothetical protein ACOC0Q_09050 [Wenzhouxiangella sp.]